MNRLQEKVYEFNKKGGQYCANRFSLPDAISLDNQLAFLQEEIDELVDAYNEGNIEEVIDGAGDALYVLLHFFNMTGVDADVVLSEIHTSNMSKAVDGMFVIKDGKIQKGENYFKPRWDKVLPQAAYNYKTWVDEHEEV